MENYLNYVKLSFEAIRHEQYQLLLVNTMGWGSGDDLFPRIVHLVFDWLFRYGSCDNERID